MGDGHRSLFRKSKKKEGAERRDENEIGRSDGNTGHALSEQGFRLFLSRGPETGNPNEEDPPSCDIPLSSLLPRSPVP